VALKNGHCEDLHPEDLLAAWDVVKRHLGDHDAPSTLLGVAILGYRNQLVAVEAVVALRAPLNTDLSLYPQPICIRTAQHGLRRHPRGGT
jgi:hypothetical protein